MNINKIRFVSTLAAGVLVAGLGPLCCRADAPLADRQYEDPAVLAADMAYSKAAKPIIFNIGSAEQIKGAIAIGPVGKKENLEKFKQQLAKLPKDKEIIVYCGCCPLARCPNIRPAAELLEKMRFTNAKLLKLTTGLKEDWTNKGYPIE
jgi:thiosulfate/3-mercaptopyruvate sulfurtransferase